MKFLCVPCDTPMKLTETTPPDRGSVALTYACPACGYEMAMLTNPAETEMVGSLGVRLGSGEKAAEGASKCPFSGMLGEAARPRADSVPWSRPAVARLETVPEFVRPMAKTGIEKYAKDHGYAEIDERVLDEARHFFGM